MRNGDPLTGEQAQQLLGEVDIVRDPVHGDIRLTAFERRLIDTEQFQRLKLINQLATTVLAYPGALHTRFLHSLGVLHVCTQILATCKSNCLSYSALAPTYTDPVPAMISPYQELLARLCALLHDMTHVAFGHTLARETNVLPNDEWKDPVRIELIEANSDGSRSDFLRSFVEFLTEFSFRDGSMVSESCALSVWQDVKNILTAHGKIVLELPYPFIHDIVGNTICADLIDYVKRDMYFCGLAENVGDRFLKYLAVMPVEIQDMGRGVSDSFEADTRMWALRENSEGVRNDSAGRVREAFSGVKRGRTTTCCRLVLLLYRYNERQQPTYKHDIVVEAVDLIRRRLAIAEKVYFHRTKTAGSAMLGDSFMSSGLSVSDIWSLSDAEVLKVIEERSPDPDTDYRESSESDASILRPRRARLLAEKLRQRRLFKPVYRVSYRQENDNDSDSKALWNDQYPRFRNPKSRGEFISKVERLVGLLADRDEEKGVGCVSIYCPDKAMNLKWFDMLVMRWPSDERPAVHRLQDTNDPQTSKEISLIIESHKHLWRFEILVDPSIVMPSRQDTNTMKLASALSTAIGLPNAISEFERASADNIESLILQLQIESCADKLGLTELPHRAFQEVANTVSRESAISPTATLKRIETLLCQYKESPQSGNLFD